MVLRGRLSGTLAVTRAFGDHALKKDGLIANPYISKRDLPDNSPPKVVVLASDGLWDVMDDNEAIEIAKPSDPDSAERLVKEAMKRQTRDNVAVLVLTV